MSSTAPNQTFLRSSKIASRAFGTGNPAQLMTAIPRTSFEFYVQFQLSAGAQQMLPNARLADYNAQRGMTFKVKVVDKPKLNLVTEELNQYNKRVVVYKKIDYQDTSITLYDSVDDSILSTWVDYFTYYFADSRVKNQNAYLQSPVESKFELDSGWGFSPLLNNSTNFFDNIIVYALFANTYTAYTYVNPKITAVDWGSKDYSSSDPELVTMQFKYEAINYFAFGQPFTSNPYGFMPDFGFDTAQDAVNYPQSTISRPTTAIPRIFGNQLAMVNQTLPPVSPSNNVSRPNAVTVATVATPPAISSGTSSLTQPLNFGQLSATPSNFTAQTIQQQIATQSGQIGITQIGGGLQYTNSLTGAVLNLPPVSSALLNNPIRSNNPAISSTALALAQGYYGSSVPQEQVQAIASVAAYISATQGVPIASLLGPNGVSSAFLTGYNSMSPPSNNVGLVNINTSPPWPGNPTLRGSMGAAITGGK